MPRLALVAAALLFATPTRAAEIILRDQAAVSGPVVRLGDIADIAADDPAERDELVTTPLMPAPAPGATQYLTSPQVVDLLATRGLDVAELHVQGAHTVAIGDATTLAATMPVAATTRSRVNRPSKEAESGATALASDAILNFLRTQSGHQDWTVAVQADTTLVAAMPHLSSGQVTVHGGRAPWTGRQRFELRTADGEQVFAQATVQQISLVAFATRAIDRGALVRTVDVEIRPYASDLPATAIASLDTLIGKEAVQAIRPDQMVLTSQIRSPIVVRRGERVEITARARGVAVRTFATAQQDGSVGDLVMVETLEGRQRYAARVTGSQKLEVFAASPAASDLARLSTSRN